MKPLTQFLRMLLACVAVAAGGAVLAAQSDDSGDSQATPTLSASHRRHTRVHQVAAESPTPAHHTRKMDEDDSAATPTPSPSHHKHATSEDETAGSATPTPTRHARRGSDDEVAGDESPTPKPTARKHRFPAAEDTEEQTPSPTPTANHSLENGESDNGDMPASPTPRAVGAGGGNGHSAVAADASINPVQLQEYSHQPGKVQSLITSALALTTQNLTYTYGSADPANGGMDCSGFIYYVLTQAGLKDVPRDASEQYSWVRKADNFRAVISRNLDGFEMDELKPGDLLFWTGTYQVDRDPPVTHTMIYLGREKSTGKRVMAGSSDGRSYHGESRWGVSVFDFKESPPPGTGHGSSQFIGYGAIPGLRAAGDAAGPTP